MRALVIEDDGVTADHVAATLQQEGYATAICNDGADGLRTALQGGFDLIIIDRMLPSLDGLDVIGKLREREASLPILVLSALGAPQDRVAGLDTGADDYLAKPFEPSELAARVRALMRRAKGTIAPDVMVFHDIEIRPRARTLHRGGKHIALSPKEFDLLMFFAENAGRIVTRRLLHEKVWKLHFDPQTNVADVHVGRLRRKIEGADPASIIATVRGEGYIFMPGS